MNVKVSIGEAIDKLSILELKLKKISDNEKRIEIQKEINELQECNIYKNKYGFYYNLLMYINEKIWDLTDTVKTMTIDNPDFSRISNDIFEYNQKRFRIKNWFNLSTTSNIKEQKSYASTYCKIRIENEDVLYNKIPEINYLLLEYDLVSFDCDCISIIKNLFKNPTIIYDQYVNVDAISEAIGHQSLRPDVNNRRDSIIINLADFIIPENEKQAFEFTPITYIAGGLLGDFIQSLSVVCEYFYVTGRKGIILLSDKGDKFRNGLENTYKDTYTTIKKQKYIYDYTLFTGEKYDVDLTIWRNIVEIPGENWHYKFSTLYGINWGKHTWMEVEKDPKWSNKVLVNTTSYRWPLLDFQTLYHTYKDDLLYISSDIAQYNIFCEKTNLQLDYYNITDFEELCCAISSCKLFVGNLSSPLSIAHSLDVKRVCGLFGGWDDPLNTDLDKIWPNLRYSVDSP
jgi:hypothetical protein